MNKAEKKEYNRQWRLKNKERCQLYQKKWYLKNKGYFHIWRLKNKVKSNLYQQKWRLQNPEKVKKYIVTQNSSQDWLNHKKEYYKKRKQAFPWLRFHFNACQRCTNSHRQSYKYYGGRGIKYLLTVDEVKQIWFRDKAWLLKKPSIDRKNPDGNYTLENVQFIEMVENLKRERSRKKNKGKNHE